MGKSDCLGAVDNQYIGTMQMRTCRLLFFFLPLCGILFQFCKESTIVETPCTIVQPPIVIQGGVHLAVGNMYHWRYIRTTSYGNFSQWYETYTVVRETTINGDHYFVLSTGEIVRCSGNVVFAYSHDSVSIHFRLDASIGQSVPFLGYQVRATFVDTNTIFGETQRIITVSNQSLSPVAMDLGRYATKFGLIEVNMSESTYVTRGTLVGARVGTVNYGQLP
jgi:hypothetical protein